MFQMFENTKQCRRTVTSGFVTMAAGRNATAGIDRTSLFQAKAGSAPEAYTIPDFQLWSIVLSLQAILGPCQASLSSMPFCSCRRL